MTTYTHTMNVMRYLMSSMGIFSSDTEETLLSKILDTEKTLQQRVDEFEETIQKKVKENEMTLIDRVEKLEEFVETLRHRVEKLDELAGEELEGEELDILKRFLNVECTSVPHLHRAIQDRNYRVIELLIKYKYDINKREYNYRSSPLHYTVMVNDIKSMKLLIDNGADMNAMCINGGTPLHWTYLHPRDKSMIKMLIENGTNRYINDNNDCNYIDLRTIMQCNYETLSQMNRDIYDRYKM